MPNIRVLPDNVANQIAAGEVIERPAAVVKELLENSLDAQAKQVEIEFRNGGKSYIRVEDDGCGMPPDEAVLSLERHATSKIREASDLLKVTSFGFRGEALPSIASISVLTLRTRTKEAQSGSEIVIRGGKWIHQKACGMPPGTCIEVSQLFHSVPARRKFLKTENTETSHIIHLTRLYAAAHPEVSFTLIENGREVFKSPICANLRERIQEIWGKQLAENLIKLPSLEEEGLRLHGLLGKPGIVRSTKQEMITMINGRPVDSRTLHFALIESYQPFLPKGRYPVAFLFLEISPAYVDVNIHPTKRQVRFQEEEKVRSVVQKAIESCLASYLNQDALLSPIQTSSTHEEVLQPAILPSPSTNKPQPIFFEPEKKASFDWRFVGKVHGLYALFETRAGLVIMNCRSAHERIWFETLQKSFSEKSTATQSLVFPVPLELDPVSASILEDNLDFFKECGFTLTPFGRHFFRLEAIPQWLSPELAETFVRDWIGTVREGGTKKTNLAGEILARMAATRAIRFGDSITREEIIDLAKELLQCKNSLTCPRGHLIYFELTKSELENRL